MIMRTAQSLCFLLLASCATPAIAPLTPPLTWAEVEPILTPLTYRNILLTQCELPGKKPHDWFVAELKLAGASPALQAMAGAEIQRIRDSVRDEPNEYVCNAELTDSTETNAATALAAWETRKAAKP